MSGMCKCRRMIMNITIIKKVFFVLLVIFFPVNIYPDSGVPSQGNVRQWMEFSYSQSASKGIERDLHAVSVVYDISFYNAEIMTAIQQNGETLDAVLFGSYSPFVWEFSKRYIKIGFNHTFHYQRYRDISDEYDFIFDSRFGTEEKSGFSFYSDLGFYVKRAKVFAIEKYVPWLTDRGVDWNFYFEKKWKSGMELFFNFGSHDLFRYPLFISPHYTLGAAFNMKYFRISAEGEIRMTDMFTTAPNIDGLAGKVSVRFII